MNNSLKNGQSLSTELLIQNEQTRLLYDAFPVAAAATLINALILSYVQWNVVDNTSISIWFALITLLTLIRLISTKRFLQTTADQCVSSRWKRQFELGAITAGVIWGGAAIFLFPANLLPNQVLLAFVIAGMCAGAVTSLSYSLIAIRAFLVLCLAPIILRFLSGDTSIMLAMGIMSILFFTTLWVSSKRIYTNTKQNIRLRLESDDRQKALEESEARYRLIFNSAPVGIVQFDQHGKIIDLNDTFVDLIGSPREQLLGKDLRNHDIHQNMALAVNRSLQGETGYFNGNSSAIGGNKDVAIRAYMRGFGLDQNDIHGGVAIFEDISEDKRVERMKDEFISTVSHELRTPLTSIRGSLGLLSEKLKQQISTDTSQLLDIANRNTGRLLLLINDILDINKIESGKVDFNFEHIAVMPFLDNAIEVNRVYGQEYDVEFKITQRASKLVINADHHRLMQVFSNLLSNAAKFSQPGATVDIAVYNKHPMVRIEVIDKGIGIPQKFYARVFEKFAQYDSSDTRQSGGTGLGLSITRAIIEQHNGVIGFESEEGVGTSFYLELPLVTA